jgi:hypothetical protein
MSGEHYVGCVSTHTQAKNILSHMGPKPQDGEKTHLQSRSETNLNMLNLPCYIFNVLLCQLLSNQILIIYLFLPAFSSHTRRESSMKTTKRKCMLSIYCTDMYCFPSYEGSSSSFSKTNIYSLSIVHLKTHTNIFFFQCAHEHGQYPSAQVLTSAAVFLLCILL